MDAERKRQTPAPISHLPAREECVNRTLPRERQEALPCPAPLLPDEAVVIPFPGHGGRPLTGDPHIMPPQDRGRKVSRSRLARLMGVQVIGTGSYVPSIVLDNADLAQSLGFDAEWIEQRTGIRKRRHCPPNMATSDMCFEAAQRCIESAGVDKDDIDLLLVATATPDVGAASTACLVQQQLGLCVPAVDLMAACAGFMYALVTGMQYVASGCSRLALVVGGDTMSRVLNPNDQRTYPLFGDGAGAVLLAPGTAEQGLMGYTLGSDGTGAEMLIRRMGGSKFPPSAELMAQNEHFLMMDGRGVFKWAVQLFSDTLPPLLEYAGVGVPDIDLWVLHQANQRIISAIGENSGIDQNRLFLNLQEYGNTTAGSVPLALDDAVHQGLVRRGRHIVLSGFGAGLAWGTAVMRW